MEIRHGIYDSANRLTSDGTNSYSYDANGNLISDGTNSYTWDQANRLLTYGGSAYEYNGLGQRVSQEVSSVVTQYLLDMQPGLYKVIKSDDGTQVNRFLHAGRGISAFEDNAGDWSWMIQDGLGSVRGVVDDALVPLESRQYAPYGEVWDRSGTAQTDFGYTGEWTDQNDLVHLRARYLDPGLGVFISADPVETPNRYGYVGANPITRVDRTGLIFENPFADSCSGGVQTNNPIPGIYLPSGINITGSFGFGGGTFGSSFTFVSLQTSDCIDRFCKKYKNVGMDDVYDNCVTHYTYHPCETEEARRFKDASGNDIGQERAKRYYSYAALWLTRSVVQVDIEGATCQLGPFFAGVDVGGEGGDRAIFGVDVIPDKSEYPGFSCTTLPDQDPGGYIYWCFAFIAPKN